MGESHSLGPVSPTGMGGMIPQAGGIPDKIKHLFNNGSGRVIELPAGVFLVEELESWRVFEF